MDLLRAAVPPGSLKLASTKLVTAGHIFPGFALAYGPPTAPASFEQESTRQVSLLDVHGRIEIILVFSARYSLIFHFSPNR